MKHLLAKWLAIVIVLAASIPIISGLRRHYSMTWLESAPFKTLVIKGPRGIASTRHSYIKGPFGVMEIGAIRIAREGHSLGGRSSAQGQGLLIAPDKPLDLSCSQGSTGVGLDKLEYIGIDGGLRYTCNGLTFDVAYGHFEYGDLKIDVLSNPTLIVISKDGAIKDVSKISGTEPAQAVQSIDGEVRPVTVESEKQKPNRVGAGL